MRHCIDIIVNVNIGNEVSSRWVKSFGDFKDLEVVVCSIVGSDVSRKFLEQVLVIIVVFLRLDRVKEDILLRGWIPRSWVFVLAHVQVLVGLCHS